VHTPCWSSQGATIRLLRGSGSRGGRDLAVVSLSNCRRRASHPPFVPTSGIPPLWNATIWGHEQARTSSPEMVQQWFCFRQDAWGLATYTPGKTGQRPWLRVSSGAPRRCTDRRKENTMPVPNILHSEESSSNRLQEGNRTEADRLTYLRIALVVVGVAF